MAITLERGDLVWVNFSPQKGGEQAGHRPAFIVSPRAYNAQARCVLACPITGNIDPWPWKVILQSNNIITGAVLVDQIRTLDVEAREIRASGKRASAAEIDEVLGRLATLTGNHP